jgi:hypothetical protein
MQSHVRKPFTLDCGERLGHAVDEGFDPQKADCGLTRGLIDEMLAAAKSDFDTDFLDADVKERAQIGRCRRCQVERQPRQQCFDQVGLVQPQPLALAAAKKSSRPLGSGGSFVVVEILAVHATAQSRGRGRNSIASDQATAFLMVSAMSVFSQEKPPSASGARPK